ncbi:MAG TPA: hypothetical protein VEY09_01750 [Pyrinomonadaceae bacterium]|nr:hypothetical protein [Pyrinomonadaceae bacterium]
MSRAFTRVAASALLAVVTVLAHAAAAPAAGAQDKKKKATPQGTPFLWAAPEDIARRDLFHGPGGRALLPDTSRVTFVEEEKGGYSTKYRIRDGAGRVWVAKVGKEAQSETAANRLVWAAGYPTEIVYLVPRLTIPGKGTFENVRLEARPEGHRRLDEWKWNRNPFTGTKPMQGLVVMMALLNNWDIKDSNNKIIYDEGRGELRYVVSDLGATFGRTGELAVFWLFTRSRNNPGDYAGSDFVEEVKHGRVHFTYGGKRQDLFDDISVEEARWLGSWLSRLSDGQLADAFRAANYTPEEVRTLSRAVRERINELAGLRGGGRIGRHD